MRLAYIQDSLSCQNGAPERKRPVDLFRFWLHDHKHVKLGW